MIQQAYVEGVSTRRVDDLVKALGCEGISKSQVSRICQELDVVVDGFLGRPLDGGPYPYLWLDALTQKVREDGRIVNVSVVVATAVNGEGKREIIGMDVGTSEDGAFWLVPAPNNCAARSSNWVFHCVIWFGCTSNWLASSESVRSPRTVARATRLRLELCRVVTARSSAHLSLLSPRALSCPQSGSDSTYPTVQISGATSHD